jgi:hypothetical protein
MLKKKVHRLLERPLSVDYSETGFGDKRLSVRVQSSIDALEKRPGSGFPKVFGESGSEGFYRLLRNEAVSWQELLGFHISSTFSRAQSYQTILCIHDTTVFKFGGESERDGLGWVG